MIHTSSQIEIDVGALHSNEQSSRTGAVDRAVMISVVVPVYNRAKLVTDALDSIAASSYRPIEVIVVDGGSSDGSGDVVEAWAHTKRTADFDVRMIIELKRGVSAGRNAGIAAARGDYVAFLDADDLIQPHMLKTLADALERNAASFAYCQTEQASITGQVYAIVGQPLKPYPSSIPDHNWHISGLLVKREVLARIGGFREGIEGEDWEIAARIKAFTEEGVFVREILSTYRIHDGPQLIKDQTGRYPKGRERAICHVVEMLQKLPVNSRVPRRKCARLMFRNALHYYSAGDQVGCARCLDIALRWSDIPQKLIIRAAAALVRACGVSCVIGLSRYLHN
jgi:glycosyltransferase involved in cell wall biosynthesis